MKWTSPALSSIVERQITQWTVTNQARADREVEEPLPVITVSRDFGARGREIAHQIAEATEFSFWDKELVEAIGEEKGASMRLLKSLDEVHVNGIQDAITSVLIGSTYTNSEYLQSLMRLVHTLGRHGRSVIVGRGAAYMLKSESNLRVRFVAPAKARIRWLANSRHLTEHDAQKLMQKMDKERTEFVKRSFGCDPTDPSAYDIVLNTAQFDHAQCVKLVLNAYQTKVGKAFETP